MDEMRIPIYPSVEVIFPGQLLVLQPMDAATVQLVRFCREYHRPLGVVLISGAQGHTVARVGTLARILGSVQNAELGDTHIVVVGRSRFQMLQMHYDRAYLEATVRQWPWLAEPRPEWSVIEQVGDYLRRYVEALSDVLPPALLPEALLPDTAALGVLGAALLQLSAEDKQNLLEVPATCMLLKEVLRYMRAYVPMAERLATMPPPMIAPHEQISLN